MSQSDLAEAAGVTNSAISDYERGKVDPPEAVRSRIEEALGASEWFEYAQALFGWMRLEMEGGKGALGLDRFFKEAAARAGGGTEAALRAALTSLRRKRK